ncbi:MAG: Sua5/YciO/YrdC/YwlC family protein, partial [Candidatus Marinimicrobia bacterium]|nr:Sua5/YciO/YrdC/YwlC family protein [Candidatus Neomarinimicrobiota bacterium]
MPSEMPYLQDMAFLKNNMPTKKIEINGIVQGVGFRPFVYRIAKKQNLTGYVINTSNGVKIIVTGEKKSIETFIKKLQNENPPASKIKNLKSNIIAEKKFTEFEIRKSKQEKGTTLISPDLAVCEDCVKEMFDAKDKRHLYTFINCTNCGPRFSIIESTPYDRPSTAMRDFVMCDYCENEYINPLNRRFHAQPIACPECGPEFVLLNNKLEKVATSEPIKKAVELLKNGKIVAIKGIGGFHLACDATNSESIKRLRKLKDRPHKPFAVMTTEENVSKIVEVNKENLKLLKSVQAPILILKKTSEYSHKHKFYRKDAETQKLNLATNKNELERTSSFSDRKNTKNHEKINNKLSELIAPNNPNILATNKNELKRTGSFADSKNTKNHEKTNNKLSELIAPNNPNIGVFVPYAPIHYLLFDEELKFLVMTSGNINNNPISKNEKELQNICDYFLTNNRPILNRSDDSVMLPTNGKYQILRRSRGFVPSPITLPIKTI